MLSVRTSAPIISRVTTGEVESAVSSMDSDLEAFSTSPVGNLVSMDSDSGNLVNPLTHININIT